MLNTKYDIYQISSARLLMSGVSGPAASHYESAGCSGVPASDILAVDAGAESGVEVVIAYRTYLRPYLLGSKIRGTFEADAFGQDSAFPSLEDAVEFLRDLAAEPGWADGSDIPPHDPRYAVIVDQRDWTTVRQYSLHELRWMGRGGIRA